MTKNRWLKSYENGIPAEIDPLEFSSINDVLNNAYNKFADLPAFHNMGKTLTYKELQIQSLKFASYLQNDLKLKQGDRVALIMPNILQYPICLFGILQAGLVAVNVNPLYTARELEHQLKDSDTKAIVIFSNSAASLEKIKDNTNLKHIIVTQIGDMLSFPKSIIVNFVIKNIKKMVPKWNIPEAIDLKNILNKSNTNNFKPVTTTNDDMAFLQYTGGTTGVSKGAILTHGNIVANMIQARSWIKNTIQEGKDIIITPLPLYHIFSLTANCFTFSSIGALNVLITNPRDIPGFVKELKNWNFTAITGVNTLFNALVANKDFKDVDFSYLKVALGGGMAVQKAVAKKWKDITGKPLIEAYGLTETSPAVCMNPMTLKTYNGCIGLPVPSTDVRLKDDQGVDVPLNEVGEIAVKGPQVMKGYWNKPEETENVMTKDGFFLTGDMGFMNEEGLIKLVDRKKDMILVSGFNVYPNEVEDIICTHPKVFEAACIGVACEKSGEAVKLFVVKKDETLTENELKLFSKENLTAYKVPKFYEFRSELPKSNVGKILRKELRD